MFPQNACSQDSGQGRTHGRLRSATPKSDLDLIEIAVATELAVPMVELRAATRRTAPVAFARQTVIYLAHTVLGLSYSIIARTVGRDRTTVAHACRLLEQRRDDPAIDAMIAKLEQAIGSRVRSGVAREVLPMRHGTGSNLPASPTRLLIALAGGRKDAGPCKRTDLPDSGEDVAALLSAGLLSRDAGGALEITPAGRSHLARLGRLREENGVDLYLAQHIDPIYCDADKSEGRAHVLVNGAESPLARLARRRGRDGRPLIDCQQRLAGERLRAEFTRAQLTPRVTANWTVAVARGRRGQRISADPSDAVVAARQRVRHALERVGPEFAGLLLDVCCFLKRLEDVERERAWPPRSAKVVLQLGLARLAQHYGLQSEARGRSHASVRMWRAPDAGCVLEES